MDGDLETDRRACFCNWCNGQLVARRTFYEYKKRHAFVEDVCGGEKPLIDPFDADVSSSEDDLDGASVKGDLDKALGEIVESKDICSKPGDGIPPLKVSRLTSEESIQVDYIVWRHVLQLAYITIDSFVCYYFIFVERTYAGLWI